MTPKSSTPRPRSAAAERGLAGEALVADTLGAEGWEILARRFRAGKGEIDIVARREGTIAFVEVKSWKAFGPSELERAVGARKRAAIVESSQIWLSRNRQYNRERIRFDLFLVDEGGIARRVESAFTE